MKLLSTFKTRIQLFLLSAFALVFSVPAVAEPEIPSIDLTALVTAAAAHYADTITDMLTEIDPIILVRIGVIVALVGIALILRLIRGRT